MKGKTGKNVDAVDAFVGKDDGGNEINAMKTMATSKQGKNRE